MSMEFQRTRKDWVVRWIHFCLRPPSWISFPSIKTTIRFFCGSLGVTRGRFLSMMSSVLRHSSKMFLQILHTYRWTPSLSSYACTCTLPWCSYSKCCSRVHCGFIFTWKITGSLRLYLYMENKSFILNMTQRFSFFLSLIMYLFCAWNKYSPSSCLQWLWNRNDFQ
jgi:hypothetical protein